MSPFSSDGGIHEIPLPADVPGRLWLCGKHHIARDVDDVMARTGASTVVCLTGREELVDHYPAYVRWLDREIGGRNPDEVGVEARAIWFPIHDFSAPPLDEIRPLFDDLANRLRRGNGVIVHCAGGIGRSGTTAVSVLMVLGVDVDDALTTVRANRPMAGPEVGSQRDLITDLAETLSPGAT
jgi:protein tyrosine phosphatase